MMKTPSRGVGFLTVTSKIRKVLHIRRLAWLAAVLAFLAFASQAHAIGMVAALEQAGRTTEYFRPLIPDVGLSLAFTEIPLLRAPFRGPSVETEMHYRNGFVQLRRYYTNHHVSAPLAVRVLDFNRLRNEGAATLYWRENLRKSLLKAQFQKHGAGLQWEIIKVPKSVRAILGEGGVGLQVNGFRRIEFSGTSRWDSGIENTATYRQSKFPSLDMKQTSRFTIKGNIGSKIFVSVDQDSKRESDLSNRLQIRYKGDEDDILQTVELGNTTLNLPNSQFVGYSQRIQGLFGVKATAKLGNLDVTVITSQEKGNTEKTRFTAGAKQNVFFRRDYEYLQRTYYDIGKVGRDADGRAPHLRRPNPTTNFPGDTIVEFRLYGPGYQNSFEDPYAVCYIDPLNPGDPEYGNDSLRNYVRELLPDEDYFLEPTEFWIRLERQHNSGDILACWMKIGRGDGTGRIEVGSIGDTLALKLLKPNRYNSNSSTWDYEWKNVYSLGASRLNYDEFNVNIFKGAPGTERDESNLDYKDSGQGQGTYYLESFGLDRYDNSGAAGADRKVDNSESILDLTRGHLVFPNRQPFDPAPNTLYGADEEDRNPTIYNSSNTTDLRNSSRFYLRIETSKRTTTYSLGKVNILEGSETVTLDQQRLIRGVDYNIDYEIGQITFLNDRVLNDPNADLSVDFEYAPFITADKKSLFGARAEYSPSANFKIGSSFLYKSQKSTDRQPKLGQEQSRSIVGEVDFSISGNPQWMTTLADAMPLVETSARSTLRITGEIARSMPNPNIQGNVYLDDFEGSKLSTELGRLREYWTKSSVPLSKLEKDRARLIWYNPYYDFYETDVYDREIQASQESRIKVLDLRLTPKETDSTTFTDSWGGIIRALSSGLYDQSRAQFLEVRLATYGEIEGNLHIDLGEISEDINADGILNSEDRDKVDDSGKVIQLKDGILQPEEDTGLDMVFDPQEPGYDPVDNPDPSGDDWAYDDEDPFNYEHINGTEGNSKGDLLGNRPDTESINGDDNLDYLNRYYSFNIDLADSPYRVKGSEHVAKRISNDLVFRTYRIPLWGQSHADSLHEAGDSTLIRFARLWLDGMTRQNEVIIASLEIVENRWQAQPMTAQAEDTDTTSGETPTESLKRVRAEVINTEENSLVYYPPPGVSGYYDRQDNRREKEQSLLLKFENFEVGDTGWATQNLTRAEDYTGYRFVEMYVHGDNSITRDTAIVSLVFRLGQSINNQANNYYEFRADLDTGWAEQNRVSIDFDKLTPLKRTATAIEVDGAPERYSPDSTLKIRGNPTLTQVNYFAIGVVYKTRVNGPERLSGDIWVDELRLSGVRRDQGTAARLNITADFADLFGFTVNSEYLTYSFQGLTGGSNYGQGANLLNGSTKTRHQANTRFSFGKLLPASWRAQVPISVKYSKDISVPKLQTGSDILLTKELQDRETTTNIVYGVTIQEKFALPSKHWLTKITLDAFSSSASLTRTRNWTPRGNRDTEMYTVQGRYDLTLQNLLTFSPLGWTKYLFFPRRIWGTKFSLLPNSFRANGQLTRTRDESTNAQGIYVFSYRRFFKGQADWSFRPFTSLVGTYGFITERDLSDPNLINFSLNPRKFRLGQEIRFTQRLTSRYSLPFFGFLSPQVSYNADFVEDADPKRYLDGTRSATVNSRFTATASLDLRRLFSGKSGGRRTRRSRTPQRERTRVIQQQAVEEDSLDVEQSRKPEVEESGGSGFRPYSPLIWLLRQLTAPIDPIRGSYSHDEARTDYGLLARPSLKYRFGLTSLLDVPKKEGSTGALSRDSERMGDGLSFNSSLDLLGLLKVSTSYDYNRATSMSTTSTRRTATTFPKLSTSLSKLSNLQVLKLVKPMRWMLDNTNAKFDYSRTSSLTEKFKSEGDAPEDWNNESEDTSDRMGVSFRYSQTLRSGLRLSSDYSWARDYTRNDNFAYNSRTAARRLNTAIGFSASYSFQAPNGIRFPLLRSMKLRSTLSLNISVKYSTSFGEKRSENLNYQPNENKSTLDLRLQANYSFSANMRGGAQMNWRDSTDKLTVPNRTNHTRQVSIWLEFSF
jgi:cell surface protein SprA